jgi:hypothetical protein
LDISILREISMMFAAHAHGGARPQFTFSTRFCHMTVKIIARSRVRDWVQSSHGFV